MNYEEELKARHYQPDDIDFEKERNHRIGLIWIVSPLVALLLVMLSYALFTSIGRTVLGLSDKTFGLIAVVLSVLGVICVVGIMIGISMGIIHFNKKDRSIRPVGLGFEKIERVEYDQRSGKGAESEVPDEIKGWNWGAAGLTWIWGASNNVPFAYWAFIPFVSIVITIILGVKGSEWAWRKKKWRSVEEFKAVQKKWRPWGIGVFIFRFLISFT